VELGRKQATSQDVANLAGVSRTTVSFVLNDVPGARISPDTRQRVLDAARSLVYYPVSAARTLAGGKTYRIGLVLGEGQKRLAADAFLPGFLQGVTASVHERNYLLMLQMEEDVPSYEAYLRLIREQHVDGLILSGPHTDDPLVPLLAEERFPLILHGHVKNSAFPCVDVNNQAGAYQAVSHLIGLGHCSIGFISNAPLTYAGAEERLAGYQQALAEHSIPVDDRLVHTAAFLPRLGRDAMQDLLSLTQRPTAVFAASDVIALGAMSAIQAAGLRVPDDMAVVGFDDIFLAEYACPALTTVRVPAYELGWTAAEMVIALIEGDQEVASVVLEPTLVVRDSCGAKKGYGLSAGGAVGFMKGGEEAQDASEQRALPE
jgi:DNA-binding LacI/PurR family transcriptional regulator